MTETETEANTETTETETEIGTVPVVEPVTGPARPSGTAQYLLDPDDPFPGGFLP
ncbi:hypothetical protein DEJ46_37350 [Streptomyces venezuelae]|uniref:Uncharacterized protein n=1 Tax=Streptomyces venezuelae TaxID=54571 RepID=A0A5P2B4L0_STRVZ|nr:hypothetical protein DEJ46_37350 [Streptomyces venezuelae]